MGGSAKTTSPPTSKPTLSPARPVMSWPSVQAPTVAAKGGHQRHLPLTVKGGHQRHLPLTVETHRAIEYCLARVACRLGYRSPRMSGPALAGESPVWVGRLVTRLAYAAGIKS